MKIAYVSTDSSSDITAWSGTVFNIRKSLESTGLHVIPIDNLKTSRSLLTRTKKLRHLLQSKVYLRDREPSVLKDYAAQAAKALKNIDYDIVLSPGTIPIAHLSIENPIVFWTDATFAGMQDFYPSFSNLCDETIAHGNAMEQLALTNCRLAIYSSDWAARSALTSYTVDPAKVKVVPFGANLDSPRQRENIIASIANRPRKVCRLLFVGVDWARKGGDLAVATAALLNQRGLPTELHIVGSEPPGRLPDFVRQHGFVSKATADGRRALQRLFSNSHFLILPSRAECVAIAFAEASAFGLPSLTTAVGGIPSAVHNERNGYLFSLSDGPDAYASVIMEMMRNQDAYFRLAVNTYDEYAHRLNWEAAGAAVKTLLEEICQASQSAAHGRSTIAS